MTADTLHEEELLIVEAFGLLWPEREFKYTPQILYSGRFSEYNANIRLHKGIIELRLSHSWKDVSKDIKIGLIQDLLLRILREKADSMYIDLYNNFVKNVHIAIPKNKTHPILEESFNRISDNHFLGLVEMPNLIWGRYSKRKLGSYDFKTDTISISKVFLDIDDPRLLDHVMYHEILHKQVKFEAKGGRAKYHTKKFRELERAIFDHDAMEKRLNAALRRVPRKKIHKKRGILSRLLGQ